MGGGKRKYNQKIRFRKFHKDEHVAFEGEKKTPKKEEDTKALIDLWQTMKKKQENH